MKFLIGSLFTLEIDCQGFLVVKINYSPLKRINLRNMLVQENFIYQNTWCIAINLQKNALKLNNEQFLLFHEQKCVKKIARRHEAPKIVI
jgi:hypothetical protein